MRILKQTILATTALVVSAAAFGQNEWPDKTHDGLERQDNTEASVVYWRPDATLEGYKKVYLVDASVAFHKNWKKSQNSRTASIANKITSTDMENIKAAVAEEFRAVFIDELQNNGGFEIVDELGEDVLLIKPAIINLFISAPDVRNTQQAGAIVSSAGEMTLYLEFYDGYTGQIFGRVLDRQVDDKGDVMITANRVTNKRDADKMFRSWAVALREHMSGLN